MAPDRTLTPRLQLVDFERDEGVRPINSAPLQEGESRVHRDNRGTTHVYACGCKVVIRGTRMRRKFCAGHGAEWPGGGNRG